jgi:hypothetical protein
MFLTKQLAVFGEMAATINTNINRTVTRVKADYPMTIMNVV